MTNREWLNSLPNKDFVITALFELPLIGKSYSDSISGLTQWMDEEWHISPKEWREERNENKETNNNH